MSMSEEKRESRRSLVRIYVTYCAAAFLFCVGSLLVAWLMWDKKYDEAKDLFMAILPVSAAVVSYWFAGRRPRAAKSPETRDEGEGQ